MDASWLRKKILEKDQDGALQYVEELFMNCMEANTSLDGLYQIALKTILLLQDIKSEYHLNEAQSLKGISELMDRIYQAEDIFGIRTILMLEITAVITLLHTVHTGDPGNFKQYPEELQGRLQSEGLIL